jgi:hypothetical protein
MEIFYIVVLSVSVFILILALTFVGLIMRNTKNTVVFPSSMSQCPDLWIQDGSYCKFNGKNSGTYQNGTGDNYTRLLSTSTPNKYYTRDVDSAEPPYFIFDANRGRSIFSAFDNKWNSNGTTDICAKKEWANANDIQWTGIKEYNNC